jgi:hypothetical protein
MPTMAVAYFQRLEAIDFIARGDRGLGIRIGGKRTARGERLRHQGCRLRRSGERDAACGKSKGEFQKVPAFHDISSSDWLR